MASVATAPVTLVPMSAGASDLLEKPTVTTHETVVSSVSYTIHEEESQVEAAEARDMVKDVQRTTNPSLSRVATAGDVPAPKPPLKKFTLAEVSLHNTPNDLWFVIDKDVYDVTSFKDKHPGGAKMLMGVAGKDATKRYEKYHRRALLEPYKPLLLIGTIVEAPPTARRSSIFDKFKMRRRESEPAQPDPTIEEVESRLSRMRTVA